MEALVSLCKRRGFVYPASEIYGGINGFWDYGPLGVQLKNNIRDSWWKQTVESPTHRPRRPPGQHRRPRQLDHPEPQNLDRQRPRRGVQRSDAQVYEVRALL